MTETNTGLVQTVSQHVVTIGTFNCINQQSFNNPCAKIVNTIFIISSMMALFVDPLFVFTFSTQMENKCFLINMIIGHIFAGIRVGTDFIYAFHLYYEAKLADDTSMVDGAEKLFNCSSKTSKNRVHFILNLISCIPAPEFLFWTVVRNVDKTSSISASRAVYYLCGSISAFYIPRVLTSFQLLARQSARGFIFESAWAISVISLLQLILAGHVVGSCWYIFGLQRMNQCFMKAFLHLNNESGHSYIHCGNAFMDNNYATSATTCLSNDGKFNYGIFKQAVLLSTESSMIKQYIHSLAWGFQQITTLASSLVPSYFEWEGLFMVAIVALRVYCLASVFATIENFILAPAIRRLKILQQREDIDRLISYSGLSEELQSQVKKAELLDRAANKYMNENLLQKLPGYLQQEIRHHLFTKMTFQLFNGMEKAAKYAFYAKLRRVLYVEGAEIFYDGCLIDKMIFIMRGSVRSTGAVEQCMLFTNNICGGELLAHILNPNENLANWKVVLRKTKYIFSTRTVTCTTEVEAYVISRDDVEDVVNIYEHLFGEDILHAIRLDCPYYKEPVAIANEEMETDETLGDTGNEVLDAGTLRGNEVLEAETLRDLLSPWNKSEIVDVIKELHELESSTKN